MNITRFIESSKRIEAYRPSPNIKSLSTEIGIPEREVVKLDANENLFLEKHYLNEILHEAASEIDPRIYPQHEEEKLKQKIMRVNNVKQNQIVILNGGDQIIEILFSLLTAGEKVTAVSPTFSMYPRIALQRRLNYMEAPLENDFSLNIEKILSNSKDSSILIICNPNNPTGNQFPIEDIKQLLNNYKGLTLIDEAYQEYSKYTIVPETNNYPNLIVLRTFSKAYGLAGLRLGYCITNEEFACTLRDRYLTPYPVSSFVLNTGCKILENQEIIQRGIDRCKSERKWLVEKLNNIKGVKAFQTETNFVLFNTIMPYKEVYTGLLRKGIIVRKIGSILDKENCLRVTVAPRPILEKFIEKLKEITN
jgi:histidinol-phosphate aminotransferase